ncbi:MULTISPECIES: Ig-like domain-containing protein [Pseudomonas]|uniref:Ig-like domain-containing protein n=1 Tax=Pseudomonas TaxID=286 RepID=UPI001AE207AB|nr:MULTISPECIES: Ig-like domain-containing protein [unclassified Pseudomonas]MBP1125071.1 hypothetical protein [Pseudomonas sp. PvP025]MDQ0398931.1 hypothetical protein [Pseudomonas sp. PvP006]
MSTIPVPSYDDLPSDPYSAYPSVDLTNAQYPEKAAWGVGTSAMSFGKLTMAIEAWHNLSVGDYYAVRIKDLNNPAASAFVQDVTDRYYLSVDKEKIPEGTVEVFCRVLRAASRQESRSSTQWALFKQTLPGGYDLRVWEPWHSELKLSLEGLPEGSIITADGVANGVWCLIEKYQHIRQNDTISIVWAGIYFDYIVSPADAAGAGPLRIEVPADVIAQGNQYGLVYVVFKVVDVVGNTSGGKYEFSKPYPVRVELDTKLYEPPIFTVDTDEAIQVDFDTQSRSVFALKPTLPRYTTVPNPRHMVTVVITIIQAGQPDETVRLPAVPDKNLRGEPINVPGSIIEKAAGGRFLAYVEVNRSTGALLGRSGSTEVSVVGTPSRMPAPQIMPIEGTLIPIDTDIAVTMPTYQPHDGSWLEALVFQEGKSGGGGLLHVQTRLAGPQGGVRDVSKDDLKQFDSKGPFSIFYRTNNGRGLPSSIRESESRTAEIGFRVIDLPAPAIKFAEGGNIDPKDVKRSVLLMSFPYIGASPGSTLYWTAIGADSDSSDCGSILIDAATEGPLLTELWIELKPQVLLGNVGGLVAFSYSVKKAGTATTPDTFLRSEVLNLTVGPRLVLALPKVLEADKVLQDQLYPKDVLNGATVRVSYKTMRADDDIIVSWKGEFGISIAEVTAKGDPLTNTVDVRIPPDIIALAIREGGNYITVSYRFTRGQTTYRSEPLALRLLLVTALPLPTLNNVTDMVFPLLALGNEATIKVNKWIFIRKNQKKFLTIRGTLADGKPLVEAVYLADEVTDDELANGVSVFVPVDRLRALKDGTILSLDFSVSFAERDEPETAVSFGHREYRVQAIPANLPAPAFDNKSLPSLTIAPLSYVSGAVVAVVYTGMTTSQIVTLEWIFPDATIAQIATQNGGSAGRVDFAISPQIIAQSVGKIVTLRYKVTSGSKTITSEPQVLTVSLIPVEGLPQALINVIADKGTLNLAGFAGNATLSLPQWKLISPGQRVWINLRSAGVAQLPVLAGYVVTATDVAKGLVNVPVLRTWLEGLGINSAITVDVFATFDGNAKPEYPVIFKPTTYTVMGQLKIAPTAMSLSGVAIKNPTWARTGLVSIGNTASRVPTGGLGPYTFSSSNPRVASVDAGGNVTGNVNGSAVITAKDRNGASASYPVYVSNVFTMALNDNLMNWETTLRWAASVGGGPLFDAAIYDVLRVYGAHAPVFSRQRWTSSGSGCPGYWAPYIANSPNTGAVACQYYTTQLAGICLVALY